jgi:hypothetical protein
MTLNFSLKVLVLLTVQRRLNWSLIVRLIIFIIDVMPQDLGHRRRPWIYSRLSNISSSWIMVMLKHLDSPMVITLSVVSLDGPGTSIISYLLSEWTSCNEFTLQVDLTIWRNILWVIYFLICHLLGFRDTSVYPVNAHHLLLNHIMLLFLFPVSLTLLRIITWLLILNYI